MCVYTYTLYHIYKNIDNITHFDCSLGHSLTSSDLRNIREPNISMEITRFKTVGGSGQSEVELVIPAHFFIQNHRSANTALLIQRKLSHVDTHLHSLLLLLHIRRLSCEFVHQNGTNGTIIINMCQGPKVATWVALNSESL